MKNGRQFLRNPLEIIPMVNNTFPRRKSEIIELGINQNETQIIHVYCS